MGAARGGGARAGMPEVMAPDVLQAARYSHGHWVLVAFGSTGISTLFCCCLGGVDKLVRQSTARVYFQLAIPFFTAGAMHLCFDSWYDSTLARTGCLLIGGAVPFFVAKYSRPEVQITRSLSCPSHVADNRVEKPTKHE